MLKQSLHYILKLITKLYSNNFMLRIKQIATTRTGVRFRNGERECGRDFSAQSGYRSATGKLMTELCTDLILKNNIGAL